MLPVTIKFQAFIPRSLGKPLLSYFQNHRHFNLLINKEEFVRKIKNIDAKGYTWLPEPGNRLNHKYFATDDVEMFHRHTEHTTRLSLHAKISPAKIGNMSKMDRIFEHSHQYDDKPNFKYGGLNSQHSGLSHQVKASIKRVPEMTGTGTPSGGHHYEGVCSDVIEYGRADEDPLNVKITNALSGTYFHRTGTPVGNNTTTIKVAASAGYPFIDISPHIDLKLKIRLHRASSSRVEVAVEGQHDDFPAYELIIGRRVAYQYNPSDYGHTGPGIGNLTKSRRFQTMEWVSL